MKLHLLENRNIGSYATFGSYWDKGETAQTTFRLTNAQGEAIPVQTEIAAFWPDGSVKWACHTADARVMGDAVEVLPGEAAVSERAICVEENADGWHIDAGLVTLDIPKAGSDVLAADVRLGGQLRVARITPVFLLERREQREDGEDIRVRRTCTRVQEVAIEAAGPLECVVKYTGYYDDCEKLMPFVIRMCVGLDAADVRFDHTFIYNGVEERDFLKGMGLRFHAPLAGEKYNHHVKFVTDAGVFHEPAALMEARIPRVGPGMKVRQLRGENLHFTPGTTEAENAAIVAGDVPVWNKYALTQLTADSYTLQKRTKPGRCMLNCRFGRRTDGAMAVTGEDGGILLASRDFWQRYPSGLEVEGLGSGEAECTVWFHSPEAQAYDFRHYDDRAYPYSNYEGFEWYGASADGIATTSQCAMLLVGGHPADEMLTAFSAATQKPAVYVASPEEYHAKRTLGYWSLPCTDNDAERSLEGVLDKAISFYQGQIEQRRWYGLFDYGDFMHSYDANRHTWKYDIGGCAWQNTELVPTYWLWLYFLRTGREDVFSLAEAMSRHCSETDIYHHGPMKGIGSRHNVRHWGCSCKEPRVSMAGHHRPMLYLTGDRRIGDVLDEVVCAAESLENVPFYRDGAPEYPVPNVRTGPDWSSLVSNWMTAHERHQDENCREKILRGIEGISEAPMRLGSGPAFDFDAATGRMTFIGEQKRGIHLALCMGEPQVWMETADAYDHALLKDMLAEFGHIYLMTEAEREAAYGDYPKGKNYSMDYVASATAAYGAVRLKDADLARCAWHTLLLASPRRYTDKPFDGDVYAVTTDGLELTEHEWISTNYVAQWCLNVIVCLDLIRDHLPDLAEADRIAAIPANIGK
ncbi:MAG: hypothetical protein IJA83_00400 [Clostridia bacterium]|nr:hypothetical protein [Clostridia bacterium]